MSHADPSVFYTVLDNADERDEYIRLQPTSEQLHFEHFQEGGGRLDKRRSPPTVLPLFTSAIIPAPAAPHRAPYAPPSDGEAAAAIFVGGPVWAMDWLRPPGGGAYLAVAAHSEGSEESVFGARVGGRSVVQARRP
jgi:hypothetical protein